jgi:glutamyl-tRNA reductase
VFDQLVIVNLRREAKDAFPAALNGFEWRTCLRRVLFLNQNEHGALIQAAEHNQQCPTDVEIHRGEAAFTFLLEVICGLNSPLVGETAVMGQFREFLAQAKFPNTAWGNFLRQFMTNVLGDAKRVRHDHLQGLGSQSYGSLVRQHVKGMPEVAVLGAGQLGREILPWLLGKTKARVFYRNFERAKDLFAEFPEINLTKFTTDDAGWELQNTGLVIAAPLTSTEVESWVGRQDASFSICLDLRGEAETDPLSLPCPVIKLSELFDALRNDRKKLQGRVTSARAAIKRLAQRQTQQAQFRPFGWEDLYLCA